MKKILIVILVALTCNLFGQSWTYKETGNAFDGKIRTSSIIGSGYKFPYTNPMFVINVFNKEIDNPNIYLTNVPYGGCDNNRVLIKFDDENLTYYPGVTYQKDTWFLDFSNYNNIDKFSYDTCTYVNNLKEISCITEDGALKDVIIGDKVKILSSIDETMFWIMLNNDNKNMYKLTIGFIPEAVIFKIKKFKEPGNDFIKEIKNHSIMYLRMTNECLKADYKFSLNGSSAAMKFIFTK